MKIEILGTGCYNCIKLESLIDEILDGLGQTDVEVVRVGDEKQIRHYIPLDEIPGLLIDGVLASVSEVPPRESLVKCCPVLPSPIRSRGRLPGQALIREDTQDLSGCVQ